MTIEEYFGTLQQSFVEIWKNHLQTSKYRDHKALNDYYEDIVDCEGVEWLDLGMPEAMWKLKAEKFGPLIVSIDSYGNNLIENNKKTFQEKKEAALENLKGKLDFMH